MRATPSILATAIATLLLGCSDGTGPSDDLENTVRPRTPVSFQLSPASAILQQGETRQLAATYSGIPSLSDGTVSITWFSTDETVATVGPGGLVRGVGPGQARIIAALGPYRATAAITVHGMKKHETPIVCLLPFPRPERRLASPC